MQTLRQFLRTPKGTLLTIFLALFGLGAAAIGWQLAAPQMLAAVLGATLTDLVVERFHRRGHGWPVSAVLSGMIVGFVLSPVTPLAITNSELKAHGHSTTSTLLMSDDTYLELNDLKIERGRNFVPSDLRLGPVSTRSPAVRPPVIS